MGQSRSKPREKKVEEEKSTTTLVTKTKEKVMEKEAKQPDKESQPAESLFGTGTSKHSRPSSSSEAFGRHQKLLPIPLCLETDVWHISSFYSSSIWPRLWCGIGGDQTTKAEGILRTEPSNTVPPHCRKYSCSRFKAREALGTAGFVFFAFRTEASMKSRGPTPSPLL
uniref:spermatogenesis-associated protein 33 isoform X1 n=1 Tax=Arvicanthis niloticus TaxID=61156 RepID=UPI001486C222|nr:spermatogenesis-associated protein 33 isoform X1 [Arvicanthis niloticus]